MLLIYVDTSPSVIITPTTYFHHMQHVEEYRQSPAVGTFIRWVRFIGILSSLFLTTIMVIVCSWNHRYYLKKLSFIGPNEQTNIPIIVQIFLADIGVEFLRIAAIHTPTPLSTAMGLIAAVLIGQIAIDVGLFVPEVILYVAVAAIGNFATPSYELSIANKIGQTWYYSFCVLFSIHLDWSVGITVFIILLVRIRSFNTPYLWPLLPFAPKAFLQIIVRQSCTGLQFRPSIFNPEIGYRQPQQ